MHLQISIGTLFYLTNVAILLLSASITLKFNVQLTTCWLDVTTVCEPKKNISSTFTEWDE